MSKKLSSRRHFMIGTAGMGAAALLGPAARVLGANERIGVGVIGVGGRGTALLGMALRRAEEKGDVEILAVCDAYQRNLTKAAQRARRAKQYIRHADLLSRPPRRRRA